MELYMLFSSLNWLAIITCTLLSMVSGTIWYNPKTFFPIWWKVVGGGKKQPGMENMGTTWALTILSSFVQATFMALVVTAIGSMTIRSGMSVGFLLWLGLIAPTYLVNKLFAGHGLRIWAIEVGNHLVNFLIFGALLSVWQ
jgi:hypothetical protein